MLFRSAPLYDMHGNVEEWCLDRQERVNSPNGAAAVTDPAGPSPGSKPHDLWSMCMMAVSTDPAGPSAGSRRIDRGGGWHDCARFCRSADFAYDGAGPGLRYDGTGFRVVLLP